MNDRLSLRRAYDRQAATYGASRNSRYDAFRDRMLDRFAELVRPVGTCVLDLGSGPGLESRLLRQRGLDPVAVDFSVEMAQRCRRTGVSAVVTDLYHLGLASHAFDGAWMSFSLLHVPKADAGSVIRGVCSKLRPGSPLMILLFEGVGEGPRTADAAKFGVARHFSFYQATELCDLLSTWLTSMEVHRLDISPRPTLVVAGKVLGATLTTSGPA